MSIRNSQNQKKTSLAKRVNSTKSDSQQIQSENQNIISNQSLLSQKSGLSKSKQSKLISQQPPEWKKLETGLQMFITEEMVEKFWGAEKIRLTIINFLNKFFNGLDIMQNFESMDIQIIAEFHAHNLIFSKQILFLDNQKTAILMNLLWTLLISNNQDYGIMCTNQNEITITDQNFKQKSELAENENFKKLQENNEINEAQNQTEKKQNKKLNFQDRQNINLKIRKNIETDYASFAFWIKKHSINNEQNKSQAIFTQTQIYKIVEFAKKQYFDNYRLIKNAIYDAKLNEEIKLNITIDEPSYIPPLKEALYMGQKKIIVNDSDEEEEEAQEQLRQSQMSEIQGQQIEENEQINLTEGENNNIINQNEDAIQMDDSVQNEKDPKIKQLKTIIKNELESTLNKFNSFKGERDIQLEEQIETILNPKKKK